MSSVLENFDRWKEFLGERVDQAQDAGMSMDQIQNVAYRMGDFLANKVDPKNPQERLLKDLWEASDENDQKALARMMINLAQKTH
ncbi:hypothetical protein DNHGIG_26280 [Collibacillus ludicampi]|jgi:hypothetical protein|uniref:DUF3243 domain-containing protein n=1 Tax=Collibacillus ludicampi TaxID=2771369 RepID=A0AAV4LHT0_9BACL|nr:DUF3243 domain-containing protein [Collibacillus ludicampi]GIM47079.1 hypothetical protein DNHGIG_26280 [Collibacillus ludicampi]